MVGDLWKKYYDAAEELYKKGLFSPAFVLYFKSFVILIDKLIFLKNGKFPRNHKERFEILRIRYPDLYIKVDLMFNSYRDTYRKEVGKNECDKIRKLIAEIVKEIERDH